MDQGGAGYHRALDRLGVVLAAAVLTQGGVQDGHGGQQHFTWWTAMGERIDLGMYMYNLLPKQRRRQTARERQTKKERQPDEEKQGGGREREKERERERWWSRKLT